MDSRVGSNFDIDLSQIDPETLRDVHTLYEEEALQALVDNRQDRSKLGYLNHKGAYRPHGQQGMHFSPTQRDYFWMQRFHNADWDDPDFVKWFKSTPDGEYSRVTQVPEKVTVGFTGERRVAFRKTY